MASNVSTVDGMGFEEVNQSSYTDIISGTNIYASSTVTAEGVLAGSFLGNWAAITDIYVTGSIIDANTGRLKSTSIENATELFGYRIKAGSVLMGDSISGLISFVGDFITPNYFLVAMAREYNVPQFSRTGSQSIYCGSGIRRASGCWIVGGSATVVDWIAVGI